jgi:hypothetical protein
MHGRAAAKCGKSYTVSSCPRKKEKEVLKKKRIPKTKSKNKIK